MNASFGRLTKIDLRRKFETEAGAFTPWLAQEENLALLAEAIGIELELEAQEKRVGPFRADILCKDVATDAWVLIENQIERTDHLHLGQLLTYAAGLDAVTIVWIAEKFTDEHRAALDWLNKKTEDTIHFFGLELELWQIGDSAVAPKFNIRSQPNDWSAIVQQAARQAVSNTGLKQLQLSFWVSFRQYMEINSSVRCQKPSPQHWMTHSIGKTGIHLASIISSRSGDAAAKEPEIRVELVMAGDLAKQRYAALENEKERITAACGGLLIWYNPPSRNVCRIFVRQSANFLDETSWPEQQEWLRQKLELFQRVFGPMIQSLPE